MQDSALGYVTTVDLGRFIFFDLNDATKSHLTFRTVWSFVIPDSQKFGISAWIYHLTSASADPLHIMPQLGQLLPACQRRWKTTLISTRCPG